MGCVYEGLHLDLRKRVAIKTLLPSLASSQDARARFLREGESAARIRHPHVVDITDVGGEGRTSYMVMEYLEGEDLAKMIAREGQLPIPRTADIILPVAAAVSAAHDTGVIHRDLKPENIFLCKSKMGGLHPKVLDFGISKVTGDRHTMVLTGTGATFGTTFYLPPEQLRGARQADEKSDQYALGTILYECLTGRRAFEGNNVYQVMKDIAEGRFSPARSRRPDLPPALEGIIARAMNVVPDARFPSVRDFGAALLPFASPNGRMVWQGFFDDGAVGHGGDGDSGGGPLVRGTMFLANAEAEALRPSRSSPAFDPDAPPFGSLSTLRHASGESTGRPDGVPSLRPSRRPLFTVVAVVALAAAVVGAWQWQAANQILPVRSDDSDVDPRIAARPLPRRTFRVEIETDPRGATIELDGRPVGKGALDEKLPVDGIEHVLVARAPGYADTAVRFTDRPPAHLLVLEPKTVPSARSVMPPPPKQDSEARAVQRSISGPHLRRPRPPRRQDHRRQQGHTETGGSALAPNGAPIID